MSTILDRIKDYKLADVAARKAARPLADVEDAARAAGLPRGFERALRDAAATGYGLIAEIKKARDRKSTRLNSSHSTLSRMPSSA